jgi:Bacterial regulatory helix-turn-helix protein, lysR family
MICHTDGNQNGNRDMLETKRLDEVRVCDLEMYVRTVRAGNMSAAARELGLRPATVCKRISMLETHLGIRLLNRNTRNLVTTLAGRGFYERAGKILTAMREAEEFLASSSQVVEAPLNRWIWGDVLNPETGTVESAPVLYRGTGVWFRASQNEFGPCLERCNPQFWRESEAVTA